MNEPNFRTMAGRLGPILGPPGPEITCEECFEFLDRYVELEFVGSDAEAAVPGMRAHLIGCPACGEDHKSLLALVRSDSDVRPLN